MSVPRNDPMWSSFAVVVCVGAVLTQRQWPLFPNDPKSKKLSVSVGEGEWWVRVLEWKLVVSIGWTVVGDCGRDEWW